MSQRVGGTNPGTYLGVNALTPPNFRQVNRAPTINDTKTFRLGDIWQQTGTENFWILAKLSATQASPNVQVADWVKIANGSLAVYTLTGNTGGAVGVDGANNINVVGDGTTITVAGNPGTHTLTISTVGSGVVESLVGDDNIPVTPLLGAIDVLGTPLGGSSVAFTGATPHELRLNVTDANDNTIIGLVAGNNPNTGQRNTGLGKAALADITSGTDNTCIGAGAGFNITSGSKNTTVGEFSLGGGATTASNNTVIGYHAGINYTTSESSNILIGNDGVVADNNTIRIGTQGNGAGQQNAAYMAGIYQASVGATNEFVIVDNTGKLGSIAEGGFANSFVEDVGTATPAAGILNIIGGTSTGGTATNINTFGSGNTVQVRLNNSISQPNTNAAGTEGLYSLGGQDFLSNYGTRNTFIGQQAGNRTLTTGSAIANTALGQAALHVVTTGDSNTALGASSLVDLTTGLGNVCAGSGSGADITSGGNNVIVGTNAGLLLVTGSNNVILGNAAGSNYNGAESGNIQIGSGVNGVVGESNVTRIAGIRGTTTNVNDAIAVLIDSTGQLGTVSSSIRFKENVEDMGSESDAIMRLRPVKFNYKERSDLQTGLIAEEVYEVMPRLVVRNNNGDIESVKYHELSALLLNEVQKLRKELDELKAK